jgi:DNA-directed RNA polymerase specialized sigma24 family protein
MMARDDEFEELMVRLRTGDDDAATAVFGRFVHRLIALAAAQFEGWMRDRVDVEDAVLSACKSFFLRQARGGCGVADWDELWSLLATITLRKCANRRDHVRAARRSVGREVRRLGLERGGPALDLVDRAPSPVEAAILTETVEQLFRAMEPEERPIVEQILMGCTAAEIAAREDCSQRTVRRVRARAKARLQRLITPSGSEMRPGPAG